MIVLTGVKGDVTELAFGPSGRVLAASGGGRGLELWDIPAGEQWGRYERGIDFRDGAIAFHPTKPVCFALGWRGMVEIETDTKKARMLPMGGRDLNLYDAMAALPVGSALICICNSWYERTGTLCRLRWTRGADLRPEWDVQMHDRNRRSHLVPRPRVILPRSGGKTVLTLDGPFSRSATYVDEAPRANVDVERLTVWSAETGEQLQQVKLPTGTLAAGALAPNGRSLVTCHANTLSIWDTSDLTATPRAVKRTNRSKAAGLAFHPSGRFLAVACNDKTVTLYDAATWEIARVFTWEIGRMRSVTFSPDGTLAAAGSDTGKVVVWDVDL